MSYETRTYDDEHGTPVIVMVVKGRHDTSRLIDLFLRAGNCEQLSVVARLRRQLRRHSAGTAALRLLRAHGGPDLLVGQGA